MPQLGVGDEWDRVSGSVLEKKKDGGCVHLYLSGQDVLDKEARSLLLDAGIEILSETADPIFETVGITANSVEYRGINEIREYIEYGKI